MNTPNLTPDEAKKNTKFGLDQGPTPLEKAKVWATIAEETVGMPTGPVAAQLATAYATIALAEAQQPAPWEPVIVPPTGLRALK